MRYDHEYFDGMLSLSVCIFKEVYISNCDRITFKAHKVGKGCIRFIGLIGLELYLLWATYSSHRPINFKNC